MPQVAPYIPNRDADLDTWLANFSSLITTSPATYGLVSGDATAIAAAVAAWHAAYLLVTSASTKTAATVSSKNTQKVDVLAMVRPYAQTIALNAGVSSSSKIALGLNPRTSTPSPIAAPTTHPVISLVSAPPLQHVLRYRDEMASPSVKAKPYGAIQVQIYATASATAITNQDLLDFKGVTTKCPTLVAWDPSDKGMQAYYAARWVTRTGLVGPWSPIVSYTVAG